MLVPKVKVCDDCALWEMYFSALYIVHLYIILQWTDYDSTEYFKVKGTIFSFKMLIPITANTLVFNGNIQVQYKYLKTDAENQRLIAPTETQKKYFFQRGIGTRSVEGFTEFRGRSHRYKSSLFRDQIPSRSGDTVLKAWQAEENTKRGGGGEGGSEGGHDMSRERKERTEWKGREETTKQG